MQSLEHHSVHYNAKIPAVGRLWRLPLITGNHPVFNDFIDETKVLRLGR